MNVSYHRNEMFQPYRIKSYRDYTVAPTTVDIPRKGMSERKKVMKKVILTAHKEERKIVEMSVKTQNVSITDTNEKGDIRLEMDISTKYLTEIVRLQLDMIEEADIYVSFKIKKQEFSYRINNIRYSADQKRVSLVLQGRLYGWLRSHDDK